MWDFLPVRPDPLAAGWKAFSAKNSGQPELSGRLHLRAARGRVQGRVPPSLRNLSQRERAMKSIVEIYRRAAMSFFDQ
jgi:hypothetical protein